MSFEVAEQVVDAVLYEGYALYPYRASSAKNQVRWQFGVLTPKAYAEAEGSDAWRMQTECLVETAPAPAGRSAATADPSSMDQAQLDVRVRFLQVAVRRVERLDGPAGDPAGEAFTPVPELEVDGRRFVSWDEAVERVVDVPSLPFGELLQDGVVRHFETSGSQDIEPVRDGSGSLRGRLVRQTWPIAGAVRVEAAAIAGGARIRVAVENATGWPEPPDGEVPALRTPETGTRPRRDVALRRSLVSVHTLLAVRGAAFVSLVDPPGWLAPAAAACRNIGTWPVLAGPPGSRDVLLSSPIILYDHPQVAPESPGQLYDGTEIDEILTLRVLTMTDEEKAEARATDDRARAIVDRTEEIPPEVFARLHGAIRSMRPSGTSQERAVPGSPPSPSTTASPAQADPSLPAPTLDRSSPPAAGRVAEPPFWEPAARLAPELAEVAIVGGIAHQGVSVRLRPGPRADTMDRFLAGRLGRVEGVFESVDDETYVAVTLDDDPAADLHSWYGRFLYFRPAELEAAAPSPDRPAEREAEAEAADRRVLVAGVGNIFLGDDGFGSEVARLMLEETAPDGATIRDVGIAGIHLAYELIEDYETLILVDATTRGEPPGTLFVMELEPGQGGGSPPDAHAMDPRAVLDQVRGMRARPLRVVLVGCEPANLEEGIGLSEPVRAAVPAAVALVGEVLDRELARTLAPTERSPAGQVRPG